MSRYDLDEVMQRWAKEELTPEQAIGQLLQYIQDINKRVTTLEKERAEEKKGRKE